MGSAGRDACSHRQIVNTRLLGDVRLCSHVCLHKRYAMCDRFSPVVKTSVLRARHQSSRWLSSADISATASPFLSRRSAQAADGICFSDVRPRVCCRRASLGERVCSQGDPCRAGGCLQGVGLALSMRIAPFVCPGLPGLARPDSAQAGPDGRGGQEGAGQRWRRDER